MYYVCKSPHEEGGIRMRVCLCGCYPSNTGAAGPVLEAARCAEFCRSVPDTSPPPQSQSRVVGPVHTERAVTTEER